MSFISNNVDFGIVSDSEIMSTISNFSDDMILDILQQNSATKFRPYQNYVGNLIVAIESEFKTNQENFPQYYSEIMDRRNEIYSKILSQLCSLHGLSLMVDENTDLYSLTFCLYDFIISKFTINMINFFTNYIIAEAGTIYDYLNMKELKRKDNSYTYSKKMFKGNHKLAVIHANLDSAIDYICGVVIDMETLITVSTSDKTLASFISSNIGEVSNLFKVLFVPYINDPRYRTVITTLIRMRLQELEANVDAAINN